MVNLLKRSSGDGPVLVMCEFAVSAGRNLAFDGDAKSRVSIVMNKSARGQMLHNSAQFLLCMAGIKWRVPTLQYSRDRDIHHRPSSLCQIPPSTHKAKLPIHFGMSSCQSGNSQRSMRGAAAYVAPCQCLSRLSFVKPSSVTLRLGADLPRR